MHGCWGAKGAGLSAGEAGGAGKSQKGGGRVVDDPDGPPADGDTGEGGGHQARGEAGRSSGAEEGVKAGLADGGG